jgi:hypothetical protein
LSTAACSPDVPDLTMSTFFKSSIELLNAV